MEESAVPEAMVRFAKIRGAQLAADELRAVGALA
jgi:hypothetical protein